MVIIPGKVELKYTIKVSGGQSVTMVLVLTMPMSFVKCLALLDTGMRLQITAKAELLYNLLLFCPIRCDIY